MLTLSSLLASQPLLAQSGQENADVKAAHIESQMTDAEQISLLSGMVPISFPGIEAAIPEGVPATAGYVPSIPRLGIPPSDDEGCAGHGSYRCGDP